jgi:hypothetical protein
VVAAPRGHRRALRVVQVQAELGAPPQHIVGAARPFVAVQVVQLAVEQAGHDFGAQPCPQQYASARAVAARQAPAQRRGQIWVAQLQRTHMAFEQAGQVARVTCIAWSMRAGHVRCSQVTSGQVAARGPGAARVAQRRGQQVGGFFGELAEGRDLAAPDRQ